MGIQDRRCEYCIHYNTDVGYHCSLHIKSCAIFGCTNYQEKSFGPLDEILKSVGEILGEIIPMTINGRRIECRVIPDEAFPYDKDLSWIQVRLSCPDVRVIHAFRQAVNRQLTPEFMDYYLERIKRQIEDALVKLVKDIIKNGKQAGKKLPKYIAPIKENGEVDFEKAQRVSDEPIADFPMCYDNLGSFQKNEEGLK